LNDKELNADGSPGLLRSATRCGETVEVDALPFPEAPKKAKFSLGSLLGASDPKVGGKKENTGHEEE